MKVKVKTFAARNKAHATTVSFPKMHAWKNGASMSVKSKTPHSSDDFVTEGELVPTSKDLSDNGNNKADRAAVTNSVVSDATYRHRLVDDVGANQTANNIVRAVTHVEYTEGSKGNTEMSQSQSDLQPERYESSSKRPRFSRRSSSGASSSTHILSSYNSTLQITESTQSSTRIENGARDSKRKVGPRKLSAVFSASSDAPVDTVDPILYPCDCVVCGVELHNNMDNINHQCEQERKYECEVCKKRFKRRTHLDIHARIHSGLKPYPCNFCPQRFPTKTAHRVHVRKHTGERPFVCPVPGCNSSFKQKMHMLRHQRTHTGSRPFVCEICGRAFAQKSSLTRHVRGVHVPLVEEDNTTVRVQGHKKK